MRVYEVRPRKDHRGVAAISGALPFIIALIASGVQVACLTSALQTRWRMSASPASKRTPLFREQKNQPGNFGV
jgi:hypothetical protein